MYCIEMKEIPKIEFAHVFSAREYAHVIAAQKGRIEISYISEGLAFLEENGAADRLDRYAVIVNPGLHNVKVSSDVFHEHHTVCCMADFACCADGENGLCLPLTLHFAEKNRIHALIDDMIKTNTLYPEKTLALSGMFLELIAEIDAAARSDASDKKSVKVSPYVTKAKDYVYKHIHEPIRQKDVAEHLFITPEYLCWIFKKNTGESLVKFINAMKLAKIRALMLHENFKLKQAAELYGYADPNYVSKLYKKYFGHNISDCSFQKKRPT